MPLPLLYSVGADGISRTLVFEVDNILSVGTADEVQLTDNPVEDGSVITDHESPKPATHEVEVLVTDYPMSGEDSPGRARAAWEKLKELKRSKEMLVLSVPLLGEQRSVRLVRSQPTINVSTGEGVLRCTLSLREVQVATSQRVPAQKRKETKAKANVELGQQSTTPADASTSERSITLLEQLRTGKRGRSLLTALVGG